MSPSSDAASLRLMPTISGIKRQQTTKPAEGMHTPTVIAFLIRMDRTSNWLLAISRFEAIASNDEEMNIGAAMALQQTGKAKGKISVFGVDGLSDGMMAIKHGLLIASAFQIYNAQVTSTVQAALKMIKDEPEVRVPFPFIKPEQLSMLSSAPSSSDCLLRRYATPYPWSRRWHCSTLPGTARPAHRFLQPG